MNGPRRVDGGLVAWCALPGLVALVAAVLAWWLLDPPAAYSLMSCLAVSGFLSMGRALYAEVRRH